MVALVWLVKEGRVEEKRGKWYKTQNAQQFPVGRLRIERPMQGFSIGGVSGKLSTKVLNGLYDVFI